MTCLALHYILSVCGSFHWVTGFECREELCVGGCLGYKEAFLVDENLEKEAYERGWEEGMDEGVGREGWMVQGVVEA